MCKLKILIWAGCLTWCSIYSLVSAQGECGDVDCSGGLPDISDVRDLVNYLNGFPITLCDPDLADLDGLPGVTNNDLVVLIEYLYDRRLPVTCPPLHDTLPPVYEDTLFFRSFTVLPLQTHTRIEIRQKAVTEVAAYAVQFHVSCPQTNFILDSIDIEDFRSYKKDLLSAIWNDEQEVRMKYFDLDQSFRPGERKIAEFYLTVNPENLVKKIKIDTVHNDIGEGLIYTAFADGHLCGFKPQVVFNLCCWGYTGNVDCSKDEEPDISDITRLIDHLYLSGKELCCPEESNTDGNIYKELDISDIMAIIDYLFLTHTPLPACP